MEKVPFLVLGMDLPPAPLYKDVLEKNIIPQVSDRSKSPFCPALTVLLRPSISLLQGTSVVHVYGICMLWTCELNVTWSLVQVPVFELLHKYDGQRVHHDIKAGRRRYQFLRLPRFLGLHMKRFAKNNFYVSDNLPMYDMSKGMPCFVYALRLP